MKRLAMIALVAAACAKPLPANIGTSSRGAAVTSASSLEERALAEWTRPWPARRGADGGDGSVTLVKAPVENVASALARGGAWERDVLGKQVTIAQHIAFVVQLRGQTWTQVLAEETRVPPDLLSRELHAQVLTLLERDGTVEYRAYAEGARVEEVTAKGGVIDHVVSARLQRAQLERAGEDLAGELMRANDAYAAQSLTSAYFFEDDDAAAGDDARGARPLEIGERRIVGNPGMVLAIEDQKIRSKPEFERVDYVAW